MAENFEPMPKRKKMRNRPDRKRMTKKSTLLRKSERGVKHLHQHNGLPY